MAKTLQFRRYNSANVANTTGAIGELIMDSQQNIITLHDGYTPGGWPTTPLAYAQSAFATANAALPNTGGTINGNLVVTGTINVSSNLIVGASIVSTPGSGNNIIINPDGLADVIITPSTELYVQSSNNAVNAYSGAVVISGGLGVAKDVYIAGNLTVSGNTTFENTNVTNISITTTDTVNITNTTASISTTTGALTVAGGAGISGNLNVTSITTSNLTASNTITSNLNSTNIVTNSLNTSNTTTSNLIVNGTTTSNGNTSIIGTLNVSGIVSMNAQVVITNTSFSNTQSALIIAGTPTVATPSQDGYMIHVSGKQNVSSRIVSDSFGANTYALYAGRAARGNVTNPTAVQTGDILSRFSGNGYGTTKYQTFGTGRIDFVATENYTDSNTGSQIQFWTCPVGTNTLTQISTFSGTSVTFTGTVQPQKGFIYTPTVYPGAQTAITIDFANNSLVRAQTATGLTVTLSNLLAGKEVVAWITNTAGTNQTFTHGLSATNSTLNATTYSIPGTSTILVRYMSIDGTTQNTFVAVTHA